MPDPAPKKKSRVNPETILQKKIMDALESLHLWVVRVPVQGVRHTTGGRSFRKNSPMKGFPDLLVLAPEGLTLWLEVKQPSGTLEASQIQIMNRMASLSHSVFVVRNVEQAVQVLLHAGAITQMCSQKTN